MSRVHWGRTSLRQQIIKELERQAREKRRQRREQERQARQREEAVKLEQRKSEVLADFALIKDIKQQLIADDLLRLVETDQLEARVTEIGDAIQNAQKLGELAVLRKELKSLVVEWRNLRTQAMASCQTEKIAGENAEKELMGVRIFWERMASLEPLLNDLELSIAALGQNPIVKGWCGAILEELTGKVASIRPALDHAANTLNIAVMESIAGEMDLLNKQANQLLEDAEDKELKEQQRAYVVNGIHNVLNDMGFVLDHGPDLLNPDDPASTVILAASLPTGKNVEVKVNQNGAIYTDFDGYADDSCVQDAHRFKDNLREKFAIDYQIRGEKAHNPEKIKKGARGVPGGANAGELKG